MDKLPHHDKVSSIEGVLLVYCYLVVFIQPVTPTFFLLQFNLSFDDIYQNTSYNFHPDSSTLPADSNRGTIKDFTVL